MADEFIEMPIDRVPAPVPAASERLETIRADIKRNVAKWSSSAIVESYFTELLALVDKQAEELGELRLLKRMLGEPLGNLATLSARAEAAEARAERARGESDRLRNLLRIAVKVADEAREVWDNAPSGMKAGKLLIALSGKLPGYRFDIDEIHTALITAPPPTAKEG